MNIKNVTKDNAVITAMAQPELAVEIARLYPDLLIEISCKVETQLGALAEAFPEMALELMRGLPYRAFVIATHAPDKVMEIAGQLSIVQMPGLAEAVPAAAADLAEKYGTRDWEILLAVPSQAEAIVNRCPHLAVNAAVQFPDLALAFAKNRPEHAVEIAVKRPDLAAQIAVIHPKLAPKIIERVPAATEDILANFAE